MGFVIAVVDCMIYLTYLLAWSKELGVKAFRNCPSDSHPSGGRNQK